MDTWVKVLLKSEKKKKALPHTLTGSLYMSGDFYICVTQYFLVALKGYCTVFQHALKSLEMTGIVLS